MLFSGTAFVIALTGMLLVPDTILRSLAAGAVLVGVTAVAAAMTLLPAVLSLLGDRVDALRLPFVGPRRVRGGPLLGRGRRARAAAPAVSLIASVAILVALALPAFDLRTGSAGVRTIPDGYPSKDGFNALEREFGVGTVDTARGRGRGRRRDGDGAQRRSTNLAELLSNDHGLPRSGGLDRPGRQAGDRRGAAPRRQPRRGGGAGDRACSAPRSCRRRLAGTDLDVFVTGETAEIVDYREMMERWLPIVFAFVLGFSFVLLMVAFRSIVVPAKAIVMNLLSVGAAYGLIVLVFQKGFGTELFGFQQVDAIEAWLPLFLFSVLFGLSMDYHVFLLSRIREHYDADRRQERVGRVRPAVDRAADHRRGADHGRRLRRVRHRRAGDVPADGLRPGGRGPARRDAHPLGAGAGGMALLGDRNWYLPGWLGWLPHLRGRQRRQRHVTWSPVQASLDATGHAGERGGDAGGRSRSP